MGYPTKIATCCYCGSRAALVLDRDRHELACASCGAPLHNMKRLRQEPQRKQRQQTYASEHYPSRKRSKREKYEYASPKKRYHKKRKGLMRHLIEEAFDVIEDIFD